ncbi:hypothetical protein [Pseudoclavibacter sp. RFBA6]|uniref:DUF7169 domain-containing protein n=1 Tax=Pseudoclavibacter sp. RFBA6 TaxID=2080573 RepID=UPI000CE80829|nr:hypothetical protein [Pseudoclavibacter sp. RFBA6]PPG39492.1 hypothetical protein C5C17_11925 [Pseudoclavibacter sp. RFBA6]
MPSDPSVQTIASELPNLLRQLEQARDAQWRRSSVPSPRDDTTERSQGVRSDPTANTALDPRRLRLRAAVLRAEGNLERFAEAVQANTAELEATYSAWAGEPAAA